MIVIIGNEVNEEKEMQLKVYIVNISCDDKNEFKREREEAQET
jgi:hypothetical protein